MSEQRPFVLSIAGFDPSGGAGVLADVKTFEACGTYGMGVVSALTYQNDIAFEKVEWMRMEQIRDQISVLQKRNSFEYIKIGLIENLEILERLCTFLKADFPESKIVWDPILKASAGYEFHESIREELLRKVCEKLYLVTPNIPEALKLGPYGDAEKNAAWLSNYCNVYLKGGHSEERKGTDILFRKDGTRTELNATAKNIFPKHGSGCVLSSAILAGLANGNELEEACREAKEYVTRFLMSNDSQLGYHSQIKSFVHE